MWLVIFLGELVGPLIGDIPKETAFGRLDVPAVVGLVGSRKVLLVVRSGAETSQDVLSGGRHDLNGCYKSPKEKNNTLGQPAGQSCKTGNASIAEFYNSTRLLYHETH